jgi:hypothetical protein
MPSFIAFKEGNKLGDVIGARPQELTVRILSLCKRSCMLRPCLLPTTVIDQDARGMKSLIIESSRAHVCARRLSK